MRDFTGQKIGLLTVQSLDEINNGVAIWRCKCECGNFVRRRRNILSAAIKANATSNCGCVQAKIASARKQDPAWRDQHLANLAGQSFGRLLAIERVPSRKGNWWRCKCNCGRVIEADSRKLKAGKIVSCGCAKADPAVRSAAGRKRYQ